MKTIATPAAVLALADRRGFPRVQLQRSASVPPGWEAWAHFCAVATPVRLRQAHAALLALPDKPPAPLRPRLV